MATPSRRACTRKTPRSACGTLRTVSCARPHPWGPPRCSRSNFLPCTGHLHHLRIPPATDGKTVRVDTGVQQGDDVSMYYDPMIAKLIVHGALPLPAAPCASALHPPP